MPRRCPECDTPIPLRRFIRRAWEHSWHRSTCDADAELLMGTTTIGCLFRGVCVAAGILYLLAAVFTPSRQHLWDVVVILLLLSAFMGVSQVTLLHHGRGRCRSCGYDTSSLPPASACPECGASPEPNRPSDA